MTQLFYIGGGEAKENFKGDYYDFLKAQTYDPYAEPFVNWKQTVFHEMGFLAIEIPFPNDMFADYKAWKIVFQKYLNFVKEGDIFIAMSLGGAFLFKYLEEEKALTHKLSKIIFLAPGWRDTPDEVIGDFAPHMPNVPPMTDFANEVHLFHSQDDPVVPFSDSEYLYDNYLKNAQFHRLDSYGHFYDKPRIDELEQILS